MHGHYIWVKISTFYKDESTHLRDFHTSDKNSYLKNKHEYFQEIHREKGFPNQYQLFNWLDLYNVIVCIRKDNAHV